MADNEEIIYIFTKKKACDICKKSLEEYDGLQANCSNCPFGGDENYHYVTRQEAIRKIAEALCHKHCTSEDCTGCDHWDKYQSIEDAEAALNALLQKEK